MALKNKKESLIISLYSPQLQRHVQMENSHSFNPYTEEIFWVIIENDSPPPLLLNGSQLQLSGKNDTTTH